MAIEGNGLGSRGRAAGVASCQGSSCRLGVVYTQSGTAKENAKRKTEEILTKQMKTNVVWQTFNEDILRLNT